MYKDLMIPMTGSDGDTDALIVAVGLATRHGAHLSVLEMIDLPMPLAHPWGMMPDTVTAEVHDTLRERGRKNLADLKTRLSAEPISTEVRIVEALYAQASSMAARQAYDADLVIVAGAAGDTVESVVPHAYFVSLLLESGRPVLVIPPRCAVDPVPRRIVIAWRPTREASRAVHDALPLMKGAERVDVLTIQTDAPEENDISAERLVRHLARHGIESHRIERPTLGQTVATALLQYTRESRADLLIAGGYGHSRLREWALGGVTRELLIASDLPVFFGH
jgi:nucleotide-binding universal stress UspA family protein